MSYVVPRKGYKKELHARSKGKFVVHMIEVTEPGSKRCQNSNKWLRCQDSKIFGSGHVVESDEA